MSFSFSTLFALPMLYLDPGSGSILIQLLLAALLGIGVATRLYWSKLKAFFRKDKSQAPAAAEEEDEE